MTPYSLTFYGILGIVLFFTAYGAVALVQDFITFQELVAEREVKRS